MAICGLEVVQMALAPLLHLWPGETEDCHEQQSWHCQKRLLSCTCRRCAKNLGTQKIQKFQKPLAMNRIRTYIQMGNKIDYCSFGPKAKPPNLLKWKACNIEHFKSPIVSIRFTSLHLVRLCLYSSWQPLQLHGYKKKLVLQSPGGLVWISAKCDTGVVCRTCSWRLHTITVHHSTSM